MAQGVFIYLKVNVIVCKEMYFLTALLVNSAGQGDFFLLISLGDYA